MSNSNLQVGCFMEYPILANACIVDFINDFQDQFVRDSDSNRYRLKKQLSKTSLKNVFCDYMLRHLSLLDQKRASKNGILFIADTGSERRISFELAENDIDISLDKITFILDSLFNNFFSKKRQIPNIVWCKHNKLLSSDWEKILKTKIFGKKNFVNLNDYLKGKPRIVEEKTKALSFTSGETKLIVDECVGYVMETLNYL